MKSALLTGGLYKLIALPLILTAILLTYFFDHALIATFKFSYLLLFAIVMLVITPYGKIRLTHAQSKQKTLNIWVWFGLILLLQIVLGLLFISIYLSFFNQVPPTLTLNIQQLHPGKLTLQALLFDWGLYPWTLFALVGIALGYAHYRQQQPGLLHGALQLTFAKPVIDSLLIPATDFLVRFANLFCLTVIISVAIIQITHNVSTLIGLSNIQYFSFRSLLLPIFLYWLVSNKTFHKLMIKSSRRQIPLGIIIIGFSLFAIVFFIALHSLIEWFLTHYPRTLDSPYTLHPFKQQAWLRYWQILVWVWWLACTPLVGSLFARISHGRRIREIALGIMILPLIIAIVLLSLPQHNITLPTDNIILNLILAGFSLVIVYFIFNKPTDYARIDMGMLPLTDKTYLRRPGKTIHNLLQGVATLLGFFMIAWLLIIPILGLIAALPLLIPIIFVLLSFMLSLGMEY